MRRSASVPLPPAQASRLGFALVELIIAAGILVVVLGIGSVFLSQQSQLQQVVQARNDVQDRARVVVQVVTQDLSLAGNSGYVAADNTYVQPVGAGVCNPADTCLEVNASTEALLLVRYVTSQVVDSSTSACRQVAYRLNPDAGTELQRADVACSKTLESADFELLAEGTTGFDIQLLCSTGTIISAYPGQSCDVVGTQGYPRTAILTYEGESRIGRRAQPISFSMTQEVLMPNLKDR